ncbi:MAG: hypothetical protein ACRDYU_09975 [Actinomycetes bacterium]
MANSLEVSDRILHDRHGLGTVLSVEDGDMVCVDFGSSGRRRVRATKVTKL